MAKDFRLYKERCDYNTVALEKDSATVIEAGDMVALDAGGLAVKADANSAAIAYSEAGAGDGETSVVVVNDPEVSFLGTGDAAFAKAQRGTAVDLVVNSTNQQIDVGTSLTEVFRIYPSVDAGEVGSTENIVVRINKPL